MDSEQKLALVTESLRPGAPLRNIDGSSLYMDTWRHIARSGELAMVPATAQFLAVEFVSEAPPEDGAAGIMVIEVPGNVAFASTVTLMSVLCVAFCRRSE